MGVFTVPIKITNWQNRFLPKEKQGKQIKCEAIVDTGAVNLALPVEMIEKLKLENLRTTRVFTADGGKHDYPVFGMVELEVQGRKHCGEVIELPRGSRPLLGAVPLEIMDWHVSPDKQKLLPNPDSPNEPLLPLC